MTGNVGEILKEVHRAWDPIMQKYAKRAAPGWHRFRDRYRRHFPSPPKMKLEAVTGEKVAEALKTTDAKTALGDDGWRSAELKALPREAGDGLADLMNCIEEEKKLAAGMSKNTGHTRP